MCQLSFGRNNIELSVKMYQISTFQADTLAEIRIKTVGLS